MANEIKITLVKSVIGSIPKHKETVKALGLRKIGSTKVHKDNKAIRGMVASVRHLVTVTEN